MVPKGKTGVGITVDDELLAKIDAWCAEYGMTRSGFFTYVSEVAFSADSTAVDLLREAFVKQAIKLAVDREVAARLRTLDEVDRACARAGFSFA